MRAPTIFGRTWISTVSVIGVRAFAQTLPLLVVVAAQHRRPVPLDVSDFDERLLERISIPGIARDDVAVERGAHADSVGGEQEFTAAVERDKRAGRSWRVPRQR